MILVSGDCFSIVYFDLIKKAIESSDEVTLSRVGRVKDLGPAVIEITGEDIFRMPLLKNRRFNPFLALAEFSWFICGSNQVEPLRYFLPRYADYSDDGVTLNGAYGYRLLRSAGNQIEQALTLLRDNPSSRRVVLNMWNTEDLGAISKDLPCNTSIMLKIRNNSLDLTVINRSNDLYLGVPYNVVLFYLLQCYLARELGCSVGMQRHFTDSLHLYERDFENARELLRTNTVDSLKKTRESLKGFEINGFSKLLGHNFVLNQEFNNITDKVYSNYFLILKDFNETSNLKGAITSLPKNLLGYAAYLWFQEKKNFDNATMRMDYFEYDK